jgi:hypothetical protein
VSRTRESGAAPRCSAEEAEGIVLGSPASAGQLPMKGLRENSMKPREGQAEHATYARSRFFRRCHLRARRCRRYLAERWAFAGTWRQAMLKGRR